MVTVGHETRITAPAMRVFLLSLSIDLHQDSASHTRERAISGVTHGIIRLNEIVTWQGYHFGLLLKHTSRITQYEAPHFFEDMMIRGAFKSFVHQHTFAEADGVTIMRDTLNFSAPLGPLGWLAERLFLRAHMNSFLRARNEQIQRVAESAEWQRYLGVQWP